MINLQKLPAGKDAPNDIFVVVENPKGTPNMKYEICDETGCLMVDRFMPMPMVFPAHYGFINKTLGGDGDPVDAFVYTDIPVVPGAVVRCRPIGVLKTEDEDGIDDKLVCVPVSKLDPRFDTVKNVFDLPELFCKQLEQFYAHYKNLEPKKWVKVAGWGDAEVAKTAITEGIARFQNKENA